MTLDQDSAKPMEGQALGQCQIHVPTLVEKLDDEEKRLTDRLQDIKRMKELLGANPDMKELLDLITKQRGILPY